MLRRRLGPESSYWDISRPSGEAFPAVPVPDVRNSAWCRTPAPDVWNARCSIHRVLLSPRSSAELVASIFWVAMHATGFFRCVKFVNVAERRGVSVYQENKEEKP